MKVTKERLDITIELDDMVRVGVFSEYGDSGISFEIDLDMGQELLGQLLAIYNPNLGAAHFLNMAAALRTLTKIVDEEMHRYGCDPATRPNRCPACHALKKSNTVAVLQTHDDPWKVQA